MASYRNWWLMCPVQGLCKCTFAPQRRPCFVPTPAFARLGFWPFPPRRNFAILSILNDFNLCNFDKHFKNSSALELCNTFSSLIRLTPHCWELKKGQLLWILKYKSWMRDFFSQIPAWEKYQPHEKGGCWRQTTPITWNLNFADNGCAADYCSVIWVKFWQIFGWKSVIGRDWDYCKAYLFCWHESHNIFEYFFSLFTSQVATWLAAERLS